MHLPTAFRHWFCTALGAALLVAGGSGLAYSARVARAQIGYHRLKHGIFLGCGRLETPPARDSETVLPAAEALLRLYPHNYYLAVYAAQTALADALRLIGDPELGPRRFKSAELFAEQAWEINPYNGEVLECRCAILEQQGNLDKAIRFWRENAVEREYWNPRNHEILARLYLRAGLRGKAAAELKLVDDKSLKKELRAIAARTKLVER